MCGGGPHLELHLRVHLEQRGHGGGARVRLWLCRGAALPPAPTSAAGVAATTGTDVRRRARQCRARPPPRVTAAAAAGPGRSQEPPARGAGPGGSEMAAAAPPRYAPARTRRRGAVRHVRRAGMAGRARG